MRKIRLVSIVLVVLLALTLALTACKNAKPLSQEIRWDKDEHEIYKIGLQGNVSAESNQVTYEGQTFVKDFATTVNDYDRVKPIAVDGTLTVDLVVNTENNTVTYTTTQVVTDTYAVDNVYAMAFLNYVSNSTEGDYSFLNANETAEGIHVTSYVTASVTFANDSTMAPVESSQTIQGYYLGKAHYEVNDLQYKTVYAEGTATVTTGEGENAKEKTCELEGNVVDALQIPLVARSIDQSKSTTDGKFTAPSVSVYDFKSNQVVALTFTVINKTGVLLDLDNTDYDYAQVAVVTVGVQGATGLLYTFSSINGTKDTFSTDVGPVNKYTQVRFQSEYYTFEVDGYSPEQVEDLKYVAPEATPEN